MNTKLVTLSADEIIQLIKEQVVKREGLCISSKTSFLSIVALLDDELTQSMTNAKRSVS